MIANSLAGIEVRPADSVTSPFRGPPLEGVWGFVSVKKSELDVIEIELLGKLGMPCCSMRRNKSASRLGLSLQRSAICPPGECCGDPC